MTVPGETDELEAYHREQMRNPVYRAAYESADRWQRAAHAGPLAVDGREYQRRLAARRRRKR